MIEKNARSIFKAITWRILATIITVALIYLFTKNIALTLSVGAFDIIIKLIVYYLHERAWNRVNWGKK